MRVFTPARAAVREDAGELARGTGVRVAVDARERLLHCHHEKVVVVDDEVAFVGGVDLTDLGGDRWDTADHPASTLRCVLDFFGPERLVLGTNYPYGPEEGCLLIKNSLAAVDGLNLSKEDKEKVLGGNAAEILGLRAA